MCSPHGAPFDLMQCPDVTAKLSGEASPDHPSRAAPRKDEVLHCVLTYMIWHITCIAGTLLQATLQHYTEEQHPTVCI